MGQCSQCGTETTSTHSARMVGREGTRRVLCTLTKHTISHSLFSAHYAALGDSLISLMASPTVTMPSAFSSSISIPNSSSNAIPNSTKSKESNPTSLKMWDSAVSGLESSSLALSISPKTFLIRSKMSSSARADALLQNERDKQNAVGLSDDVL